VTIPKRTQKRIIDLRKEGLSDAKIAKKLGISENTVITYRKRHKDEFIEESIQTIELRRYRNILGTLENNIREIPFHRVVVGIHNTDFFFEEYKPPQHLKPLFILIVVFIVIVLIFAGLLLKT